MSKWPLLIKTALLLLFASGVVHANVNKQAFDILFYHDKPPLVINKEQNKGLYFDIINCLNSNTDVYHFKPKYVPKPRIESMMASNNFNAAVIGVHPNWFKDKQKKKYLWSNVLLTDQDEFVSLTTSPFNYSNDTSFKGKRLGGVRGFFLQGHQ